MQRQGGHGRIAQARVVGVVATVLALLLAGCGGSAGQAPDQPASAPDVFPVTVDHAYGSTTIDAPPRRVVALGYTDPDALLAVGVAPIGIVDWFQQPPAGNVWPWQRAAYRGATPEVVGVREEYAIERVAALQPDLIVGSYSEMTQERYDLLSGIAPVVAPPRGFSPFAAPWQVSTRMLTRAVGREARGDQLVREVEARIARLRAEHPQWSDRTALSVVYEPGTYFVNANGDPRADLLTGLGFRRPPEIDAVAAGRVQARVGAERADLLDVDALVWAVSNPGVEAEIRARPEYANLSVARDGRALFLLTSERTQPVAAAFGFNSVLSLPYVLDQLVPRLEALPAPPR